MMICLEILLYYECSTVSNTCNVYQTFNFRKIKNLFVVSARFCEIYFILQVLLYTFKHVFHISGQIAHPDIWMAILSKFLNMSREGS